MSSSEISEWKGDDILVFQEELEKQVNGRISSKWFYTHMKSSQESLPRIDVLNLMCQFVGYQNWADFSKEHQNKDRTRKNNSIIKYISLTIPFLFILLIFIFSGEAEKYTFQIIDFDTNKAPKENIQLEWLRAEESSKLLVSDSLGKIEIPVNDLRNKFIVKSPYYKSDTIVRWISEAGGEVYKVKTDDYALMVHYFSTSKVKDWKKRRVQLGTIFHDDAKIVEVIGGNIGVEFYSKSEFINRLTLPLSSLKSLDILSIERKGGQIINMRVKQK